MNIGEWIIKFGEPAAERSFGGVVPAYPIFMFAGIILVIILSVIKLRMKKIPLKEFELAIIIVVPIGILGGSIFGKIFIPGYEWYEVFFFWKPGMSLFGAMGFGTTAAFVLFYLKSKKTLISVWVYADCIIPNVLLGQALGRWGNMYNHEIMGQIVSYESLWWLSESIKARLFYFPNLGGFQLGDGWWLYPEYWHNYQALAGSAFEGNTLAQVLNWNGDLHNSQEWLINSVTKEALDPSIYNYGTIQYHAPLFLYESIANIVLWFIISFGVTNLGRWFSKPKPWDLSPQAFPGWFNKNHKTISEQQLVAINTQAPIKYKQVHIKTEQGEEIVLKLGFYQAWNKAFYWYAPNEQDVRMCEQELEERYAIVDQQLNKLKKIKSEHQTKMTKIEIDFARKQNQFKPKSEKWKKVKQAKILELKTAKQEFIIKKEDVYHVIGNWTRIFTGHPQASKNLDKINNPNNYFVIRSGVITGAYVVGYMLIRILLETQRKPEDLFIQNFLIADFIVLSLIILMGIGLIIFAQFIAPYRYREVNWLYEKSY